jgi:hypothetical protein
MKHLLWLECLEVLSGTYHVDWRTWGSHSSVMIRSRTDFNILGRSLLPFYWQASKHHYVTQNYSYPNSDFTCRTRIPTSCRRHVCQNYLWTPKYLKELPNYHLHFAVKTDPNLHHASSVSQVLNMSSNKYFLESLVCDSVLYIDHKYTSCNIAKSVLIKYLCAVFFNQVRNVNVYIWLAAGICFHISNIRVFL